VENLAEFYPEAKWQRCVVHFYRNVWTAVPTGKVKQVAGMLKAIFGAALPQRKTQTEGYRYSRRTFPQVRLRSIANSRRREQGSDTSGTRRNKKRATIHEFIRAGKTEIRMLSRQTQFEGGCVVRLRAIVPRQFYVKSVCLLFPINTCAGSEEFDADDFARASRCRQS
jgi:hypothetical protein